MSSLEACPPSILQRQQRTTNSVVIDIIFVWSWKKAFLLLIMNSHLSLTIEGRARASNFLWRICQVVGLYKQPLRELIGLERDGECLIGGAGIERESESFICPESVRGMVED